MAAKKSVRIIKKVSESSGVWRFVSLKRAGTRHASDNRPGTYFVEWWEGRERRREAAGQTPSAGHHGNKGNVGERSQHSQLPESATRK